MEIRTYFKIFARFWWVIVLATAAAGGGAYLLTKVREPVYSTESRVTLGASQSVSEARDQINLLSTLGNRAIAGTYAQVFTSERVRDEARAKANLATGGADSPVTDRANDAWAYEIEASVVPESLTIAVLGTGPHPETLARYVDATVEAAIGSSRDLFPVLQLTRLQPAGVPDEPVSPQPGRDIPLGAGLGLAVGILLALALDYLLGPVVAKPVEPAAPASSEPQSQGFMRPPLRKVRQG